MKIRARRKNLPDWQGIPKAGEFDTDQIIETEQGWQVPFVDEYGVQEYIGVDVLNAFYDLQIEPDED